MTGSKQGLQHMAALLFCCGYFIKNSEQAFDMLPFH